MADTKKNLIMNTFRRIYRFSEINSGVKQGRVVGRIVCELYSVTMATACPTVLVTFADDN